jgi:NAD(P)H-nitrite reductase large subunit
MQEIVIIGNGISGITAARHIRKRSDANITVVSGETDHFFSRTALMYIYMGHMTYEHTKPYEDWFWEKNRIGLIRGWVESINPGEQRVTLSDGRELPYDQLILALGSRPNMFGWPGQDLKNVQGLYSKQDLDNMEAATKHIEHATVVGGGLIGIEMVEMLRSRGIGVTFLVRESAYWDNVLPKEEAEMIGRHIVDHGVDLRLGTELKEIIGDEQGVARAVSTSAGDIVECQFVGLTAGVRGNSELAANHGIETDRGILVDSYMRTSDENIYAIGDCAQYRNPPAGRNAIEQVWYTGRMHGEAVAATICGEPTPYAPGPWFNSAKFFDIEYQTYGKVPATLPEGEETFYWEHANGDKCFRVNYKGSDRIVTGVNVFGIRMRHALFDTWLRDKLTVDQIMGLLPKANFDPEFFHRFERDISGEFQRTASKT